MLIHFAGSVLDIDKDIQDFRKIVKTIHNHGHILTRDWVEPAYETWKAKKDFAALDWHSIYSENMEALTRADAVIVDASVKSFSVGFQAAVALQQKKPILLLARGKGGGGLFASGIEETLVTFREFDSDNLDKIVSEFLEENKIDVKDMRFNFFIDRQIYNYLRWASHKSGKTKAEILRDLVVKEIDKENPVGR